MFICGKVVITQLLVTVLYSVLPNLSAYPMDGPKMRPYSTGTLAGAKKPQEMPLLYNPRVMAYYRSLLSNYPPLPNANVQSVYNKLREPMSQAQNDLWLLNNDYSNAINDDNDYLGDDYGDDLRLDSTDEKWYDGPIGTNYGYAEQPVADGQPQMDTPLTDFMINYILNALDKEALNSALKTDVSRSGGQSQSKSNNDESIEKRSAKKANEVRKPVSTTDTPTTPKADDKSAQLATSAPIPVKVQRGQKEYPMYRSPEKDDRIQSLSNSLKSLPSSFQKSNWPQELEPNNSEEQSLRSLRTVKKSISRNVRDVWASELESLRKSKIGGSAKIKH